MGEIFPYFGHCGTQQGGDTVSYRVRVSEDRGPVLLPFLPSKVFQFSSVKNTSSHANRLLVVGKLIAPTLCVSAQPSTYLPEAKKQKKNPTKKTSKETAKKGSSTPAIPLNQDNK